MSAPTVPRPERPRRSALALGLLAALALPAGCSRPPPDATPEGALRLFLDDMDDGDDPATIRRAYDLLGPTARANLAGRARRTSLLQGRHVEPWDMLAAGLRVTVNSDDPAYFGGYLDDNVAALRAELGLDDQQVAALARNSFDACFAPEADKHRWKSEVDAALALAR